MDPFVIWAGLWVLGWCGLFTNFVLTGLGLVGLAGLQLQPLLEMVRPENQKERWIFWNQVNDAADLALMCGWALFCETMPIHGWVIGLSLATRAACHLHIVPSPDKASFLEDKAGLFLLWVWLADNSGGEAYYFWLLLLVVIVAIRFVPPNQKPTLWITLLTVFNLVDIGFSLTHTPSFLTAALLDSATALVGGLNRWYFFV
jgi:hypothetical protein